MNIQKTKENTSLILTVDGRLDTSTAPMLEEEITQSIEGITELTLNLENLEYISSAGLRVLLFAQKIMNNQGSMTICNANEDVKEIFEITGFTDILHIV